MTITELIDRVNTDKTSLKMEWLQMESELRQVLNAPIDSETKLLTIDAVLGWHTGRGYEVAYNQ